MGEKISGHLELLYPSPYLKAADLGGKDCTVTMGEEASRDRAAPRRADAGAPGAE